MNLYYARPGRSINNPLNFNEIKKTEKSIQNIKDEILQNPDFCRDEISITKNDLISYLNSGISFFTENEEGKLTGLINFEVNMPTITIYGLCVPAPSAGIGRKLIETVKEFARTNEFNKIRLTCYDDNVSEFYRKQGFAGNSRIVYDSDDEDNQKVKYDMELNINVGGSKYKKTKRMKRVKRVKKTKNKKQKKGKKTKKNKKG
jgi:GNAT superfamily N-acetyltransferase